MTPERQSPLLTDTAVAAAQRQAQNTRDPVFYMPDVLGAFLTAQDREALIEEVACAIFRQGFDDGLWPAAGPPCTSPSCSPLYAPAMGPEHAMGAVKRVEAGRLYFVAKRPVRVLRPWWWPR